MGVGLQIAGLVISLKAAQMQKQAYEAEAQAAEEQAEMAKIEASQREVERNRKLRLQLASLGTSMSSQGIALGTSPSVLALADDEKKIAKEDISAIRLMGMSNRRKYELGAAGSRAAGRAVQLAGFSKTVAGAYSIGKGVGTA
mgnify:CR=1 FL=1|tara:strand:- start:369 stop:797 length:429 start_codon:yes stop_codon:yes gene_type:complete